jgi:pyruvate carboxylase subunit B
MYGPWKKIADGYGKMVLGYFGKTPVAPNKEVVELASKQLKLEPTTRSAREIADEDEKKSLAYFENMLKENDIEITDENIFIAAACDVKGIAFLKGEGSVNVRKIGDEPQNKTTTEASIEGKYTIVANGVSYNVDIIKGHNGTNNQPANPAPKQPEPVSSGSQGSIQILSQMPGNVWKIEANIGDSLNEGDVIMILEAMKMEIEITAPKSGILKSIEVAKNSVVQEGQLLATME